MRKNKDKIVEILTTGLAGTNDPAHVAKLFRQAALAEVSHRKLWELGVRPAGYEFDKESGRFRRQKNTVEAMTVRDDMPTTLAAVAMAAYGLVERGYATRIDRQRGSWIFPDSRNIDPLHAVSMVHREATAEGRARIARASLALHTAVLAHVNPSGDWTHLADGNLSAAKAVRVLARPFPRHVTPLQEPAGDAMWQPYVATKEVDAPLVRRSAPLLRVVHVGTPVVRLERGKVVERAVAHRLYDVRQETVFALEPAIADDLMGDAKQLEAAFQARGKGWEDMIVPAAGFVMLEQAVQLPE